MAGDPGGATPEAPQTLFSPDGYWWWNGAEWRPALSQDGLWRWNGQAWQPAQAMPAPRSSTGAGMAVVLTIAAFAGVLVLVSILVIVILLVMGNQIANVFSNVAAALGSGS